MLSSEESFRPFEALIREWLARARLREIVRVLELVSEELQHRGFAFCWTTTPPMSQDRVGKN